METIVSSGALGTKMDVRASCFVGSESNALVLRDLLGHAVTKVGSPFILKHKTKKKG